MPDKYEQQLEDYLLNRLDPEERKKFENKISNDEVLNEELEFRQLAVNGSRNRGKEQLKSRLQNIHQEVLAPPVKTRRLWSILTKVAAAITLLILGGSLFFSGQDLNPQELYTQNFKAYPMDFGSRSVSDNLALAQLNQLYKNQEYQKALPLFEKLLTIDLQNSRLLLGAGICNLELDQIKIAQSYFQKIIDAEDLRLQGTAQWYMALSFLKDGDVTKTKAQLKTLLNNPQTSNNQKAKDLLKALEKNN